MSRFALPLRLLVPLAALLSFVILPARAASLTEQIAATAPSPGETVDHAAWTKLLETYVKPGPDGLNRVDYAAFKAAGHPALKAYLARLQATDPLKLGRNERFAFLANLYNAKTIDIVLDAYPVKSIKDIALGGGLVAAVTGGPWKAKVIKLRSHDLSLDDLEHGLLRKAFKDPRVHYAVNCASVGCPNLQQRAFTGSDLDTQLDAAARAYVNSPRGVRIDSGKLVVSSIYHWFKEDFGGTDAGVLAHLRKYADPSLAAQLAKIKSISDHGYDWSLNDTAG